jgi:hypothetical protein
MGVRRLVVALAILALLGLLAARVVASGFGSSLSVPSHPAFIAGGLDGDGDHDHGAPEDHDRDPDDTPGG